MLAAERIEESDRAAPPAPSPLVGIVIVNWNGWRDTIACLESLQRLHHTAWRAFVVDNASTDESVRQLRAFGSRFDLIESATNTGWAGGNNLGIKAALAAGCDYVWLLNNDAVALPEALTEMLRLAGNYPNAAFIGTIIEDFPPESPPGQPVGRLLPTGRRIDPDSGIPEAVPPERLEWAGPLQDARLTDYVAGASMLTSRSTVAKVGLIDEDFFLNFDEVDWCRRAARLGMTSVLSTRSLVRHKGGASMGGKQSPLSIYFSARNRLLFARKHCTPRQRLHIWKMTLWDLDRFARQDGHKSWWRVMLRPLTPSSTAYQLGVRDAVLRRYGDCPPRVRALQAAFKRDATA